MLSRRKLLTGAAVMPVASVPLVTRDPEEEEIIRLWRMFETDDDRAFAHDTMRVLAQQPRDPEITARWYKGPQP